MKIFKTLIESKRQEVVDPYMDTKDIIEVIHNDFYAASDELLMMANKVLEKASGDAYDKGLRLSNLGLGNAQQAKESAEAREELEFTEANKHLIMEHRITFPGYKFILEGQVKAICHKYNLVFGDSTLYTGFVPEKNLKHVEDFMASYKDQSNIWRIGDTLIDMSNYEIKRDGGYDHFYRINGRDRYDYHFQRNPDGGSEGFYGSGVIDGIKYDTRSGSSRLFKQDLMICAPVKDMNMEGKTITDGYKVEKIQIPDPVILQPVKGGYIIITAWGDEASDPNVVNEVMN